MNEEVKSRLKLTILPAIVLLIVIIVGGYYFVQVKNFQTMSEKVTQAMVALNNYLKNPESVPTPTQLSKVQVYREELQTLLSQWQYTYKSIATDESPLDNLEFKERLKILENRYAEFKIPIQAGLGFNEFSGGRLPNEEQLQVLSRQLALVTQLIELLIENNVEGIPEIQRSAIRAITSTQSSKILFNVYPVKLRFTIEHRNLMAFLNALLKEPSVLRVEEVNLESGFHPGEKQTSASRLLNVWMRVSLAEYVE